MNNVLSASTLFEDANGTREVSPLSVLFSNGELFLTGEINEDTAIQVTAAMRYHAKLGTPLTIWLNTPGGLVSAGLSVYDAMQSYPHKLTVFCIGMAASMGAVLLAGGQKGRRFILPHAKVMIHEPLISGGFGGSASSIEKTAQSILETKALINGLIADHTGKTIAEINEATAFDNYMSAEDAVKFGICDAIRPLFEGGDAS